MSLPTHLIGWSPTTGPKATPSWEDITSYVRAFSCKRGRQHELDRFSPGTGQLILDNSTRVFDRWSDSNVKPMRRFRIQATWSAVTYNLHQGFAEGYPIEYPGAGKDSLVRLTTVDGFKVLNLVKLSTSYSQEVSDTRIGNVLTSAGWPSADRELRTGQSTMQASTLDGEQALTHIQNVVDSENGRFFIDGRGYAVFHDRHAPLLVAAMTTSQATFGDAGGAELAYLDLIPSYDDTNIWNDIQVTRTGGTTQTVTDSDSQTSYYTRTWELTGQLHTSDAESLDSANWRLGHYKDPGARFSAIVLDPQISDAVLVQCLAREIGDRITVKLTPPGGGDRISQDCWIEGIEHRYAGKTWRTIWQLSPADAITYWVLNDAALGLLGSTSRLAYAWLLGLGGSALAHLAFNATSTLS